MNGNLPGVFENIFALAAYSEKCSGQSLQNLSNGNIEHVLNFLASTTSTKQQNCMDTIPRKKQ